MRADVAGEPSTHLLWEGGGAKGGGTKPGRPTTLVASRGELPQGDAAGAAEPGARVRGDTGTLQRRVTEAEGAECQGGKDPRWKMPNNIPGEQGWVGGGGDSAQVTSHGRAYGRAGRQEPQGRDDVIAPWTSGREQRRRPGWRG